MKTFSVAGATHIGSVRKANEDTIGWLSSHDSSIIIGIVADGMGGYRGGDVASKIAVQSFNQELTPFIDENNQHLNSDAEIEQALRSAANLANEAIIEARLENSELVKMGTTLVAAYCSGDRVHIIHAGDSRCYYLANPDESSSDNNNQNPAFDAHSPLPLKQLTRDDSVVQDMLDSGSINPKDVDRVPFRNVLTKALGSDTELTFSVTSKKLQTGDQLLLCSDGIYNSLDLEDIAKTLLDQSELDMCCNSLIQQCLENTAKDNISVVAIKVL